MGSLTTQSVTVDDDISTRMKGHYRGAVTWDRTLSPVVTRLNQIATNSVTLHMAGGLGSFRHITRPTIVHLLLSLLTGIF